jgi:predicted acylesterase/phospholipase RssA
MKLVPPGDDVCPVPAPVTEEPPPDRFCDLVMTGGVASGVVYPWAVVELARAYRFRNIGGTSVGAMAAALAAAAEYGRRTGFETPFEPLRRLPASLGEVLPDGRTRMFSLFQPANRQGARLLRLWGLLFQGNGTRGWLRQLWKWWRACKDEDIEKDLRCRPPRCLEIPAALITSHGWWLLAGLLAALVLAWSSGALQGWVWLCSGPDALACVGRGLASGLAIATLCLGVPVAVLLAKLACDIRHGIIANNLGLCAGGTLDRQAPPDPEDPDNPHPRPGLSEWLHEGIQRSAGLTPKDPPLTFGDLWNAPAYPGAPRGTFCGDDDPMQRRSINLMVITSNVTHGRPYRLPLSKSSRLFYRPGELEPYLPQSVLNALVTASRPYEPGSDPFSARDPRPDPQLADLLELPSAGMPIVVAARLSLSFPLLFSAIPLYAIDHERKDRKNLALRRCLFTDGGLSSNFPIHLFDAALPSWPTFGLWLDERGPFQRLDDKAPVWLPDLPLSGRFDSWNRFDPDIDPEPEKDLEGDVHRSRRCGRPSRTWGLLGGFLVGLVTHAKDWHDRTSFRMPHVRNRVARLWLGPREGGLHIAMPRAQILQMAHRYGTTAGRLFVERFCGDGRTETPAWREQRWVRLQVLLKGIRERIEGLSASAAYASHCVPMREQIDAAVRQPPLRSSGGASDSRAVTGQLSQEQADSIHELLAELRRLEQRFREAEPQPYEPMPEPELRLRSPL